MPLDSGTHLTLLLMRPRTHIGLVQFQSVCTPMASMPYSIDELVHLFSLGLETVTICCIVWDDNTLLENNDNTLE